MLVPVMFVVFVYMVMLAGAYNHLQKRIVFEATPMVTITQMTHVAKGGGTGEYLARIVASNGKLNYR